jgi:DNA-binding YbaB/EbfC family protein
MIDFAKMMKQAQSLQKEMEAAQKRIEALEVTGTSGGGSISILLAGKGRMKSISIDPTCCKEEPEVLEDLILAAYSDAWSKLEEKRRQEMSGVAGGNLPMDLIG